MKMTSEMLRALADELADEHELVLVPTTEAHRIGLRGRVGTLWLSCRKGQVDIALGKQALVKEMSGFMVVLTKRLEDGDKTGEGRPYWRVSCECLVRAAVCYYSKI